MEFLKSLLQSADQTESHIPYIPLMLSGAIRTCATNRRHHKTDSDWGGGHEASGFSLCLYAGRELSAWHRMKPQVKKMSK